MLKLELTKTNHKQLKTIGFSSALCAVVFVLSSTFALAADETGSQPAAENTSENSSSEPKENLPTAVVWYLEMAKSGDADAQYNLGSVYETGFGVQADPLEAVDWYKKAAEQDHQLAQLKLGIMYVLGDGVRQSTIKGANWIQDAADNGNKFAATLYEKVLSPDVVLDVPADEIIKKVRPFIDLGEKKSIAKLTSILTKQQEKAKKKQPELAERFTGKSKNTLGKEIEVKNEVPDFVANKGRDVTGFQDSNIAFLQREANAGNPEAQYQLGRMYDLGEKLERDRQKAVTWYTSAANQGHAESQYQLAIAYLYGLGVVKNVAKGEALLTEAAKSNHPVAKEMLPIYKANRSAKGATSIALSWYLEKVANGDSDGMFGLGYMYENGWGLFQNQAEAKKWYANARRTGSGGAARRLRQIKAVAASKEPDPEPESRPQLPEDFKPATSTAIEKPVASSDATRASAPAQPQFQAKESAPADAQQSSGPTTFTATVTRRSPLTPIILIVFGIVMGITVFKWMRRGSYNRSVF